MTAVVITGIIASTVFKLALVGAGVKLAPPVLSRLGVSNAKPRQSGTLNGTAASPPADEEAAP